MGMIFIARSQSLLIYFSNRTLETNGSLTSSKTIPFAKKKNYELGAYVYLSSIILKLKLYFKFDQFDHLQP